jgi:hypothetical protein
MLIYAKIDDPTSPQEFFETFPPEDDYTKHLAERRIQSYQAAQDQAARKRDFEEKQAGVNLEAGERAERKLRR